MTERYALDAEHIAFVTGSGEDTNKVQSIVEDAAERRRDRARAAAPSGGGDSGTAHDTEETDTDNDGQGQAGLSDFV